MTDSHAIYRHGDLLDVHRKFVGKFLQMADIRYFEKGQLIDSPQGKAMKALHLVLDGTIECSFLSESGQKKISGLVEHGIFIGISSLDGYINHHNFMCRTSAIVASMPVEKIQLWDHEMLLSLVLMQTNKVRMAGRQIINLYLEPTQLKVVRLLLELGGTPKEAGGQEIPLIVNVTKQDVADFVGVSREHATKVIGEMQKSGLLTSHRRNIIFYSSKLQALLKSVE